MSRQPGGLGLSHRSRATSSITYADFPVAPGELDLRGDGSNPLEGLGSTLDGLALSPSVLASYGPVEGLWELRAAIGELFGVGAERVAVTSGASEALHLAFTCLADPGDTVQIPRPAFPGFRQLASLSGLNVVRYDLPVEVAEYAPLLRPGLAVVCTPNNPLGTVSARDAAQAPSTRIIWDISHAHLYGDGMASFRTGLRETDIIVFSLSKLLRLPGARIGCLISGAPEFIAAATAVKTHLSMSASVPSQLIAYRLLTDARTKQALCNRQADLNEARSLLTRGITETMALSAGSGQAGTHLYCQATDGADPWQALKDRGIVGLPGHVFDAVEPGVRLCFSQEPTLIREAVDRLLAH